MALTHCYRVRKPMHIGEDVREPGDLVPELASWPGHVQARILQTEFAVLTPCDSDELEAALSYCEPEVYPHWGAEPPAPLLEVVYGTVVEAFHLSEEEVAADQEPFEPPELDDTLPTDAEVAAVSQSAEDFEQELLEEPETLISEPLPPAADPEPTTGGFTREELEELPWTDLKDLAKAHPDLQGNSPKAMIIDTLAKE